MELICLLLLYTVCVGGSFIIEVDWMDKQLKDNFVYTLNDRPIIGKFQI